ncbi:WAT1-related protein [Glycine max]|nr:WAT1-related protein [Glycine max]
MDEEMEKLNIGSSISQIKVMGTVLSIAGALLVTLYKGSPIISFRTQPSPSQPLPSLLAATSNWVIGGLFFATAAFSTVVFLGETLHVGSVIGAVVIAIGFYTVLWAQSKEENAKGLQVDRLSSPSAQASPLLETVPRNNLVEWSPFIAMVTVECLNVGLSTLSKAAMSRGVNHFVLVVYSNNKAIPFFLASLQVLPPRHSRNCVFIGINYSSPTLGSTMSNLSPAITFVLAVTLRMEKLNIRSSISQIKVMGAVLSISGALVVTFYKGSSISTFRIQPSLLAETNNWVIGGLVFAMASVSFAAWNITQAVIMKEYSYQSTIIAYYCLFGTIHSTILSLIVVRDSNAWKISLDVDLICIFYSAIAGSVVTFSVTAWCIKRKGPVFVSMFKPAGIAIAAFSSVAFLVIIAIGLYTVLWAQSKEENLKGLEVDRKPSPSTQTSPLLESHQRNILA